MTKVAKKADMGKTPKNGIYYKNTCLTPLRTNTMEFQPKKTISGKRFMIFDT